MPYEMRLFEDTLFGGEEVRLEKPAPRALYVSAGSISVDGSDVPLDDGLVLTNAVTLRAGGDGAAVWRWEVGPSGLGADACAHRATLRLAGPVDPAAIADELLIRLDSVAFPPGERRSFTHIKAPESDACARGKLESIRKTAHLRMARAAPGSRADRSPSLRKHR